MKARLRSFGFAFNGIKLVFGKEPNMNIHLILSALVVACGFYFNITFTEWIACILCIGLVVSLELLNSAIERLVDLVSPQKQPLAGAVKDIAAGAVLIAAICAAIVGCIVFIPKALAFIGF